MARRKRLSPEPAAPSPEMSPEIAPRAGPGGEPGPDLPADLEVKSALPFPSRPTAPISGVAGEAAAAAAAAEMAEMLRRAREDGRLVVALPVGSIADDYLLRDRLTGAESGAESGEEMAALMASLRARGQQVPIEVVRTEAAPGRERYGLISGWRRLTALRRLHAETGEARFGRVLALLRRPGEAAEAYLAMVEENEIRAGLSYYERARIAVKAAEAGVFADERAALGALFAAASRPRRSKIGSFATLVRAFDDRLRHPRAIGERLGLRLARAIAADPALVERLRADLAAAPAADAAAEQALLAAALAPPETSPETPPETPPVSRSKPRPGGQGAPASRPAPGITLGTLADGRIVLSGPRVDPALRAALEAWLRDRAGPA